MSALHKFLFGGLPMRRSAVLAMAWALVTGVAVPSAAAQPTARVPRIGLLGEQAAGEPRLEAFRQGLRQLGYVEGRSIAIEYRYAHGAVDRLPELAAQLIRLEVDVLVVGGTSAALAAKRLSTTLPIVFTVPADPVGSGLVASLARPGGNVTGISGVLTELSSKQLELLTVAAPRVSRVSVLHNPLNPATARAVQGARSAAQSLALELQVLEVRQRSELEAAFSALTAWRAGAILVVSDPMFGNDLGDLARRTALSQLPAVYNRREFAEAGGLLAFGPNFSDNYRRAAGYVDKLLKGARPADLPVEQPTKFELVVNLRTARALGLTLPQALLLRADEVIE